MSTRSMIRAVVALGCGLGLATLAAGAPRTFVRSDGSDSNPCTVTLPCRTFQQALTVTAVGGEIVAVDSAGYGPVVIAQSVSIVAAPGAYAGITVFTGNGVAVTTSGVSVVLKGLAINGQGGNQGIYVSGSGVRLEAVDVSISGMIDKFSAGIGVYGTARAEMKRGLLRRNGAWGAKVGNLSTLVLDDVMVVDNQTGVSVTGGSWATVTGSTIARNTLYGIAVDASVAEVTQVSVESSRIVENGAWGIYAASSGAGSETRASVAGSTLARNQGGVYGRVQFDSKTILSVKDNVIEGHYAGANGPGWGVGADCDATDVNAIINASGNIVTRNVIGFTGAFDPGGIPLWWCTFRSLGDNMVRDNTLFDILGFVAKVAGD